MILIVPLVLLLAGGLVGLGWRASGGAIHPVAGDPCRHLGDYPDLAAEDVAVTSTTGVSLAGRFFAGRTLATVVLSHGYGGNQDELLPVAAALNEAGFNVFTYDLRGCGRSDGAVTFGALEHEDLSSVVDYLTSRPDVDEARIGAFGFSMGGATTLLAAAKNSRIKAVVADSAWADVKNWLRPSVRAAFLSPNARSSTLALKFAELRTGIDFDDLRPAARIAAISPRPILLIHGTADDVVLSTDGEQNLAVPGLNKELWLLPGVAHGDTLVPNGPASSPRVVDFFKRALNVHEAA